MITIIVYLIIITENEKSNTKTNHFSFYFRRSYSKIKLVERIGLQFPENKINVSVITSDLVSQDDSEKRGTPLDNFMFDYFTRGA